MSICVMCPRYMSKVKVFNQESDIYLSIRKDELVLAIVN